MAPRREQARQQYPWEGRVELGQTIVSVDATNAPILVLTFADGYEATFNFQGLADEGEIFAPLRDPELLRTAHPGCGGSSLEWITPEGEQIDLCADAVRLEAEGIWDPVKREWKV